MKIEPMTTPEILGLLVLIAICLLAGIERTLF